MKTDLEALKLEIEDYLPKHDFVAFHGSTRVLDDDLEVIHWDVENQPDYHQFLDVAKQIGVKLIVFAFRRFREDMVDETLEQLEESAIQRDERREYETRLKELRIYAGFTCSIELSFDHAGRTYLFELRTEWFDEAMDLMDDIMSAGSEPGLENGPDFGGFYSRN